MTRGKHIHVKVVKKSVYRCTNSFTLNRRDIGLECTARDGYTNPAALGGIGPNPSSNQSTPVLESNSYPGYRDHLVNGLHTFSQGCAVGNVCTAAGCQCLLCPASKSQLKCLEENIEVVFYLKGVIPIKNVVPLPSLLEIVDDDGGYS